MGGPGGKNTGTWEDTKYEKEALDMAGGRGEHFKTRDATHEREPLW